jgi:hypothetical protein
MPSVVLWNNVVVPFWVTCAAGGWLMASDCCSCCAFITVIVEGNRIIAIANTTTDINPIVIDGKTNNREEILMIRRTTRYRFYSKIRVTP